MLLVDSLYKAFLLKLGTLFLVSFLNRLLILTDVLALCGKVLVVGKQQGWLLREAFPVSSRGNSSWLQE